ncbi:MAG: hypothetical protein ABIJ17_00325 [Patescibacteria group bacterium]
MKIPIILTSTKGKTKEQLAKEVISAIKKFKKAKEKAEKKAQSKVLLLSFDLSPEEALRRVKEHFGIGKKRNK